MNAIFIENTQNKSVQSFFKTPLLLTVYLPILQSTDAATVDRHTLLER